MHFKETILKYSKGTILAEIEGSEFQVDWDWSQDRIASYWLYSNIVEQFTQSYFKSEHCFFYQNNVQIIDYIIPELMDKNQLNNEVCKCDFYTVILVIGCTCGGK